MKWLKKYGPLLLLYLVLIILGYGKGISDEEHRYLGSADSFFQSHMVTPSASDPDDGLLYLLLFNGWEALGAPEMALVLLNGLFAFLAVICFHQSLLFFASERATTFFSYSLGLYYPMFVWMPHVLPDFLRLFFLCASIYFILNALNAPKNRFRPVLFAAMMIGGLLLTDLFWGGAIIISLLFFVLIYAGTKNEKALVLISIFVLGSIFAVPSLLYAHFFLNWTILDKLSGVKQFSLDSFFPFINGLRYIEMEEYYSLGYYTFLIVALFFSLFPAWKFREQIPFAIKALMLMAIIYFM